MLSLHSDPRLVKIRNGYPLNNIQVPDCQLENLTERIDEFYIPTEGQDSDFLHPLLSMTRDIPSYEVVNRSDLRHRSQ